MSRINMGRVVIGGLLAGLIINFGEFILNGVLLAEEMNAAMAALNRPPIDPKMIVWFVVFGFGLAIHARLDVRRHSAALRRLVSRPRSAPRRSCWGLDISIRTSSSRHELFPRDMMVLASIWGLVEVVIAGIAGAWAYKEA